MTKNKINEYLNGEHGDLTEEEIEYLNDCLERLEWEKNHMLIMHMIMLVVDFQIMNMLLIVNK